MGMDHHLTIAFVLTSFAALAPVQAQTCPGQGSVPTPARIDPSPLDLGCAGAPGWPMWHLFTPFHREPVPHAGFTPGNATAHPRILVAWHCTGWLLVPVVPARVTTMGYVLDRSETPCAATN
jgi:hypothetical protein